MQASSICTASASDAAGNSDDATLTVTVNPKVSSFFAATSDTITTDPIMALVSVPTDPEMLIGVTKNLAGTTVSTIAATAIGAGIFDDAVVTMQSTLGSVGTAPLKVLFGEIGGLEDSLQDLIFVDVANEELVGVTLNPDNSYGVPVILSVPNICDAGRGGGTVFIGGVGVKPTRRDILVGTTSGLFYVAAGFANDGINTSGLTTLSTLVATGNFCNLAVGSTVLGDASYIVYNPDTRIISGFEGDSDDAASYSEEFTDDLSASIGANFIPLLIAADFNSFSAERVVMVFDDPDASGSVLVISELGVFPETVFIDLDMETPTDILLLKRGVADEIVLVSPNSEYAFYIRNANSGTQTIESVQIGLGFDQVEFAAGGVAFASSTTGNIVIREL